MEKDSIKVRARKVRAKANVSIVEVITWPETVPIPRSAEYAEAPDIWQKIAHSGGHRISEVWMTIKTMLNKKRYNRHA